MSAPAERPPRRRGLVPVALLALLAAVWLAVAALIVWSLAAALPSVDGRSFVAPERLAAPRARAAQPARRAAFGLPAAGWPPDAASSADAVGTSSLTDAAPSADATGAPTPIPPVDWPEVPELDERQPVTSTAHFEVYAVGGSADASVDEAQEALARRWGAELEAILSRVGAAIGAELPMTPVKVAFAPPYPARCPARGLASMGAEPTILVFADSITPNEQIRGVLAHETAHQLTSGETFVADGVLTEGIANWAAGDMMLEWQGYATWDAAVIDYLERGTYVPISDVGGLSPESDEDCIERRDRVYNARAAFVQWLMGKIGRDRLLAMPYVGTPILDGETNQLQIDSETGELELQRVPDYRAVTGHDLETLEVLWLLSLWAEK